jgi:hypothetical protein
MRSKRADIFNLYFIIFVVILCSLVIGKYVQNQTDIQKVILSPEPLLKLEDKLRVMEYNEELIIKGLIFNNSLSKESFCSAMEGYSDFLKEDLIYKDSRIDEESWDKNSEGWDTFCKDIYDISKVDNLWVIKRSSLRKEFEIGVNSADIKKINYPVEISFDYEKEYKFDLVGNRIT